jgi:colanic acid/amylovoran biosynthesis glycosyltransferase
LKIDSLGLGEGVRLAGPRSQDEIIKMLGQTDIFVLPCVTEKEGGKDNLPTVIMEAMAAGVPCVSTRLAGVPEMVIDGETGLLVDERDTEGLAGAMAALMGDVGRAREMGEAGVEVAKRRFAQEVTAGSLRRHLTAHGLVRFDGALTRRDAAMWGCYARQFLGRIPRLWGTRNRKIAYLPGGRTLTEKELRGVAG